jgi:hypothetical protein
MSVAQLARIAGLYRREAVATAARDWLTGPGAPFLGLKRSEVSALRRIVAGAGTSEQVTQRIHAHLKALAKRRKGASRWERVGADKLTLLDSLVGAIKNAVASACPGPTELDQAWARVASRLTRSLNSEQQQSLELDLGAKASLEFLDYLVRLHQAREHWKEGKNPCQASQVS